ncbi:MAG: DUF3696 domain-containing protein [Methylobacterium sp.]|nr:DUF3696 domain-containing protein [Methylobacterium sp.]
MELAIRNFKSIADAEIRIGDLTVLSGLNGAGKSSVLQALLALRQSYKSGELAKGILSLSGELVDLGSAAAVLHEGAEEDYISIAFIAGPGASPIAFCFNVDSSGSATSSIGGEETNFAITQMLEHSSLRALLTGRLSDGDTKCAFQYLNAERNGPRKYLPMSGSRGLDLGSRGEFVLQALFEHQDNIVLSTDDARLMGDHGERLRDQVEAWLADVSPGVRLDLTPVSEADLIVGGYSFGSEHSLRTRAFRATNVGFGLSYVLPVLVALLATPAGGLVLIENPEAHLHPRGQTKIGELCARAAAAGVIVLVETHSDHLMDGVRIAVREGLLHADKTVFHYFSRSGARTEIVSPTLDRSGKLSFWPENFFDQHRRNAARLLKPSG